MSELRIFLKKYWIQDSDIIYKDIFECLGHFRKSEGLTKFRSLMQEMQKRHKDGEFERGTSGYPMYEEYIGDDFHLELSSEQAERILKRYGYLRD